MKATFLSLGTFLEENDKQRLPLIYRNDLSYFGLDMSKKVEFWNTFTFQAPLENHDNVELQVWKSNLIIKPTHTDGNKIKKNQSYLIKQGFI